MDKVNEVSISNIIPDCSKVTRRRIILSKITTTYGIGMSDL